MQYITTAYHQSRSRLFLFDYDGTLTPIVPTPSQAKPSKLLLKTLKLLAADPRNTVAVISGRDHITLSEWLGELPLIFYAEHGLLRRDENGEWHTMSPKGQPWMAQVTKLFEAACREIAGSLLEQKTASVVWHYRRSNPQLAEAQCDYLLEQLQPIATKYNCTIVHSNKVIDVRPAGISKDRATQQILMQKPFDFIFAAGDDIIDEAMFEVLPGNAHTVKVGTADTIAKNRIETPQQLLDFLQTLI